MLIAEAKESGKPDEIIEKMVEGRCANSMKKLCLPHKCLLLTGKPDFQSSGKCRRRCWRTSGVDGFARFELGEGVDKGEEADFAAEVAAAVSNA